MAETYAQRKNYLVSQARNLRKSLRQVDTQVEVMQRVVQALTLRKTLITPESLTSFGDKVTELNRRLDGMDSSFSKLLQLAQSYL